MASEANNSNTFLPLGATSRPKEDAYESDSDDELSGIDFVPPFVGSSRLPEEHEGTTHDDSDTDVEEDHCFGSVGETGKCEMEGVFGDNDERWPIEPTLSPPYTWICYIRSVFVVNGKKLRYRGTGCLFRPDSTTTGVILTCAHNLYTKDLGEAISVEVIRARDNKKKPFGTVTLGPDSFRYPDEYKTKPTSNDYYSPSDYGVIMLPRGSRPRPLDFQGFGYAIMTEDDKLKNRIVQVCGYPMDRSGATMHLSGGRVRDALEKTLTYRNDTARGQSGAPVWTWVKWNWMVVGIHGFHDQKRGNEACRMTAAVLRNIRKWAKELE